MAKKIDRIKFGAQVAPGKYEIIRETDDEVVSAELTVLEKGKPIPSGKDVVYIDSKCQQGWHDVTGTYRTGPAQVATPAYREGWDRIFGKSQVRGQA